MEKVLGYDCDGREIYEYRILCAIFSNDIDIEDLEEIRNRNDKDYTFCNWDEDGFIRQINLLKNIEKR